MADTKKQIPTELIFTKMPKDRILGFRTEWISGSIGEGSNKKNFEICSGAGCGSTLISFHCNGETYTADIRTLIDPLLSNIIK